MSLFKVRDWWRVQCGSGDEEFDQGSLCVAALGDSPGGKERIVCGSLEGILRIYQPSECGFKVDDQLLEMDLKKPILQLAVGRFSASGGEHLAVLHPRNLSVYSVRPGGGGAQGPAFLQVAELYQHKLQHTAANMAHGPFGGIQGADFICVQSYDGQLSFFEQESEVFSRYLPDFLVPGPLCYCTALDSFITCNSAFELECYKYRVLAAATGEKTAGAQIGQTEEGSNSAVPRKQVQSEWKLILGESSVSIAVGRISKDLADEGEVDIIVLGEHTLFCVSERGEIRTQRRLDYHPAACISYPVRSKSSVGGHENLLIGTHTAAVLVYNDSELVWAAKGDSVPVAIRVAEFGDLPGLVVMLDEAGALTINYLGTDPPSDAVGMMEGKDLDYEEMEVEHRQLLSKIRKIRTENRQEPDDKVALKAHVSAALSSIRGDPDDRSMIPSGAEKSIQATVLVSYTGTSVLKEVRICIKAPYPISVEEDSFVLPELQGGEANAVAVAVRFYTAACCLPSSCMATITASYLGQGNVPHVIVLDLRLPLTLFCQPVPPVKNAAYKLTIDTNQTPPQLTHLFEEVIAQCIDANELLTRFQAGNVMTFQYFNGVDVSIIVSRSGNRYRVQSDVFEAMWLLVDELCLRLAVHHSDAREKEGALQISFQEALPLQDFFTIVDDHFNARVDLCALHKELDKRAQQFRSIQKRILVRSKDRNPVPLGHLDTLMVNTYNDLIDLGDDIEAKEQSLKQQAASLSGAAHLMCTLIRYHFQLSDTAFSKLKTVLSNEVPEELQVSWEEHTVAGMTQLLRTVLAKNAKESATQLPPLEMMQDTQKLKKHISIVLERISKGMLLDNKSSG